MATVSRVNGFRLVRNAVDGLDGMLELAYIPASDAVNTSVGDLVKLSSGNAPVTGAVPVVRITGATDVPYGVVVGIAFEGVGDPSQNTPPVNDLNTPIYRKASTGRYVYIVTDPNSIFEVQLTGSGLSAAAVQGYIGKNISPSLGAGSNTSSGSSSMTADQATVATTATLPLKVVGFPNRPDNVPGDTYFSVWVRPNNFSTGTGTGTAGV
jgi:hypothetical protein